MYGRQITIAAGLRYLANKIIEGAYGINDSCCQDTNSMMAFEEDLQDEVMEKIE